MGQNCPPEYELNLAQYLVCINQFRAWYGIPMICVSGFRTYEHNEAVGGKPGSAHLSCQAGDFEDLYGAIKAKITEQVLIDCGLYMEHPSCTKTWVHLQTRPTHSRIFQP